MKVLTIIMLILLLEWLGMGVYLVMEFISYSEYEKFKPFCEENGLIIKKTNDAQSLRCFEISNNQIIRYYIPKEIDEGVFVLEKE